MSNLEKLLEGVEVEWKTLGEYVDYEQPTLYLVKSANYNDKFATPVLTAGKTFILGYTDETNGIYKASKRPVIIFDDFTTANKWVDFDFKAKSSAMKILTSKDESKAIIKYIYYYLNVLPRGLVDGDHKRQWIGTYSNKNIPIPCPDNPEKSLEIQTEIVRILDKFSTLTAELQAELQARKSQYEYYRNQLLNYPMEESDQPSLRSSRSDTFIQKSDKQIQQQSAQNAHADNSVLSPRGKVEWKTLGEISIHISSGGTPSTCKSEYYNGDIPWLRTQEVGSGDIWDTGVKITELGLSNSSANMIPANCVIVAMYGATVGKVGINKIPLCTNQACANIQINEKVANYRYVYYCLLSQYDYIKSLGAGSQTNINAKIVRNLQIPIPPIAEQERIVSILDKFDTLTASISEGLPKEIELRQKQYEYYRDMLLTFPQTII